MCAMLEATCKNKKLIIDAGYSGGSIRLESKDKNIDYESFWDEPRNKKTYLEMMSELLLFSKKELATIILEFVENADEG
jgi:hypothetical protein